MKNILNQSWSNEFEEGKLLFKRDYREFTDEYDKDDWYALYENWDKSKGYYRLKMLGIWIQVNMFFDITDEGYKFYKCYVQSAMDDNYEKQLITSEKAIELCEDFNHFMDTLYLDI